MCLYIQSTTIAQVNVQLQQPPPFQFRLENMWKVTLINSTQTTYNVHLIGSATESSEGQIVEIITSNFLLPPGIKSVNSRELVPVDINVTNDKYSDVIQNINTLPSGDYEICISVLNSENGQILGRQCMQAQTQNLTQVELLQPENNIKVLSGSTDKIVSDNSNDSRMITGSFMTFSWLPPSPVPSGVIASYSIKIVEILGNQSPYDAILSNPAFYFNRNIYTNIFSYPAEGRNFGNNKRYAWKVFAYFNNVLVSESETREFSFTDESKNNSFEVKSISNSETNQTSYLYFAKNLHLASTSDGLLSEMIFTDQEGRGEAPILFSGNIKLRFDGGYRDLPFSELPKNVFTAELNPTVAFYGLPFTVNLLYSTQDSSSRQSLNSYAFNFNLDSYKEKLKSKLEDKISEMATGWEKLLMSVYAFGIGTNYPTYSEYTLKGVPVTGVNIELNPGIFYAAFSASKNQRGIDNVAYQRNLYAGRIGLGNREKTHLFFTGLYVKDDRNSSVIANDNLTLTPKANYILGVAAKISLLDDKLSLEGEGNASIFTRDTRDADLKIKKIPIWIEKLLDPKISSSFDYSYAGKISFNNSKSATKVSIGIKMIGPGYTSLGVPNLKNDQIAYEVKFDQGFFSRKISLSSFLRTSRDNLIDWKSSTTITTIYGVNLGLNFPSLPFLKLSYSPYIQKNNEQILSRKIENKTVVYSILTGYTIPVKKFNFSTNVAFTNNEATTLTGLSNYRTTSFSITENISFDKPISLTGSWGLVKTSSSFIYSKLNNFDFSVNAIFLKFIASTLGVNIAYEKEVNKKTGFYINTEISVMENIRFSTRVENIAYRDFIDKSFSYNEFLFNLSLLINW